MTAFDLLVMDDLSLQIRLIIPGLFDPRGQRMYKS